MTDTKRISDEQLADLLKLIGGADSVELKLTIPDAESRTTIKALDLDPLDAQIRQVVFFDTPDLALNSRGLVVRALADRLTILVIEHDMQFVRDIASRITVLHRGAVLRDGTLAEIEADEVVRDVYLGRR